MKLSFPRGLFILASGLSVSAFTFLGAVQGPKQVRILNHVPSVSISKSQHLGLATPSTPMSLAVALNLQNQPLLIDKLNRIYDPKDPQFGHYLTQSQFVKSFAPSASDVNSVVQYLKSQNLNVTKTSPYLIDVEGTVDDVQKAFQLEIHQYQTSKGRLVYAPTQDPLVDSAIASKIAAIVGLDSFASRVSHVHHWMTTDQPLTIGTGPNGGLSPSDIQRAYSFTSTNLTGAGQTLALFELDGYTASDISQYVNQFNITNPPALQNILVDGFSGAAGSGADEVTLDIELMMAVAPGANKILVYEGPNSNAGVLDTYAKIANDNLALQVSTSWGAPEASVGSVSQKAEEAVFMQMAAQGQTIYAAAGDSGAYDNGSTLTVDDPSSQPYVVSTGGTTLSLNANGTYASESSWGIPASKNAAAQGGGGGISSFWSIPTWQSGIGTTANMGSQTMRMVPDVSLNANPNTGYSVYFQGAFNIFGGTSCAAPLWAAFTALVNQQRATNSVAPLGFADPAIYQLGSSALYGQIFHDVADQSTNLYYKAVSGYDLSTGWGSMNVGTLVASLANPVLPPYAPTLSIIPHNTVLSLSWTAPTGSMTYTLYRGSAAAGPFTALASNVSTTSYVDTGLTDGTNYYYYVTAKDSAGQSGSSAIGTGTPALIIPEVPSHFSAVVVTP